MKQYLILLFLFIQIFTGKINDDLNDFNIAREIGGSTMKIIVDCGNKSQSKCTAICKNILKEKLIYTMEEFEFKDSDLENISKDLSTIVFSNSRTIAREKLGKRIIEGLNKPKNKKHDLKAICIYYMKWNGLNTQKC